jgi:WD40 repeat protein
MDDDRLRSALRELPIPDAAGAQARARKLALAAHAPRATEGQHRSGRRSRWRRRSRRRGPLVIASLVAASLTFAAVQEAAVAAWVRDAWRASVGAGGGRATGFSSLPGGGRILVSTGGDSWIVGEGLRRAVEHTDGSVSWSAFGNYIACACGDRLEAVDLNGRVAWSEQFAGPVASPVWSPDGNRIAFTVGHELFVTAADGTGVRGLRPVAASGSLAAWRPGPGHELAVASQSGRVSLIDTDSGRELTRTRVGPGLVSLSWSSDGRLLLAATRLTLSFYDAFGRLAARESAPPGSAFSAARISPSGRQVAEVLSGDDGREEAVLASIARPGTRRVMLVGTALGDVSFSPDGSWLLVGWHDVGSWMFFTTGPGRTLVRQVSDVAAQLDDAEPVVAGWCCARRTPPSG